MLFAVNERDLAAGITRGNADPRFSTGYGDLRHLPTVLVENHSLKPYRQRVLGTYVLLEASLRLLGQQPRELATAIESDRQARPARLPANWIETGGTRTERDFLGLAYEHYPSPASGTQEVRWLGTPQLYPKLATYTRDQAALQLSRPKAYWIPRSKPEVIDRLRLHGLQMTSLNAPRTLTLERYRLVNPQPSTEPFEGHFTLRTGIERLSFSETFPAGSVRVATDQPLGDLAVLLLEPESVDSLLAWGFFHEILRRTEYIEGYAVAPLAERMLAEQPALKTEFEAKLASDPTFAADPTARLEWFYARSKFYDDHYRIYPVGIER
jgi:hypothetical protein